MEICRTGKLLVNLTYPDSVSSFFPSLDFIGVFICEADPVVEIFLDELESSPAGLKED